MLHISSSYEIQASNCIDAASCTSLYHYEVIDCKAWFILYLDALPPCWVMACVHLSLPLVLQRGLPALAHRVWVASKPAASIQRPALSIKLTEHLLRYGNWMSMPCKPWQHQYKLIQLPSQWQLRMMLCGDDLVSLQSCLGPKHPDSMPPTGDCHILAIWILQISWSEASTNKFN